jgi:hypothetical protein
MIVEQLSKGNLFILYFKKKIYVRFFFVFPTDDEIAYSVEYKQVEKGAFSSKKEYFFAVKIRHTCIFPKTIVFLQKK